MQRILAYIKFLFCKHSKDKFVRNIYGDEIIFGTPNFSRSLWECHKCNSVIFHQELNENECNE